MHLYDLVSAVRVAVFPHLMDAFGKASAIFMLGAVCAMVARGASAATRHLIWTLTLAGALAAPALSVVMPRWTIPVPRREPAVPTVEAVVVRPRSSDQAAPQIEAVRTTPMPASAAPVSWSAIAEAGPGTTTTDESRSISVMSVAAAAPALAPRVFATVGTPRLVDWTAVSARLVAAWALGVLVALLPTVAGLARLAFVARRARPLHGGRWALLIPSAMRELDVRRHVRFVQLDGPVMPMTWGVFQPIVLLPADDFNSTIEQRLDVLRHELAHVRRYDCLTQLIGQLACALHWFNPLAWLAARELRVERERACDDEVLRAGAKASDYADYLLRVARSTRVMGAAALGGLAMARPSQMAGRLLAVLDDRRRRGRVSARTATQAIVVAGLLVIGVAAASPVPAEGRPVSVTPVLTASAPQRVRSLAAEAPIAARPNEPAGAGTPDAVPTPAIGAAPALAADPAAPALPAAVWSTSGAPSAPLVVMAAPPLQAATPQAGTPAPCDRNAKHETTSHSNWTSSDKGSTSWRVMWSEGDCQYEIIARGQVKYNRDVTDVESISSGGMFSLEQHIGDDTKRIVIRPRDDGTLERTYSVNGARQEFDAAAKAWFAEALVALDRQTAFAADQRVPAILERGGVDAVLQEITLVNSDYARRIYYTKLLSMRQLDRSQVKRVVEQAGADMSSDYELAELLVALSKLDAFGDDSHSAFVNAAKKIDSDYEKRRALNALLQRDRLAPTTVDALLDAASSIKSDYELAELLIDVSKRYAINDQTRPTYIKALGSIQSDYEHRRVLAAIVAGGGLTPAVTRTMLEDARRIGSDYELAEFLIQISKKGALDPSTRDAYFGAADKIKSDYEHHRALTPLLTRDLLTKDLAKAVLASAAKIDSDYECAQLLTEVANAIPIDDDLRPAFERAADTIQSEYDYGRAMSAVRRRVTR